MAGGRLDSRFELGSLIKGFNTQNMNFFEIKTDHKIYFKDL
jgi:hypothetical protein